MANITDKFNKVSNGNGSYPVVATVTAARAIGDKIISCDSLDGWATDTAVHFSTYGLTSDGTPDKSTQTDWKGIVVNNTITNIERTAGRADFGNNSGDKAELLPTSAWANDLMGGLLVSHEQNGKIKDGAILAANIASGAVTADKLNSSSVTTTKIADSAVTMGKIDSSVFEYEYWSEQGSISASNNSYIKQDAITISVTGTYLIIGNGNMSSPSSDGYFKTKLYVNGQDATVYTQNRLKDGEQRNWVFSTVKTLSANDKLSLYNVGGDATYFEGCRLMAIRIA